MKRATAARVACGLLGACASFAAMALPAAKPSLDFDRTFATGDDGRQSHYTAVYRLEGADHRIEVWRDRELRLRRRTDDAIESYLVRPAGSDEWTMTVMDLRRRIRTDIDRTNLLRIGHYTDWFAQAHSLARPRGTYRLTALATGIDGVVPVAACRWYLLAQDGRETRICWSDAQHVPLVIADGRGEVVWRVTHLDSGPFASRTFAIDDRGYARNDANRDIEAD